MKSPKLLDLFSGIGGFSQGLERAGFETVAFCEIEPSCQAVLRRYWPDVPIFGDIRALTAAYLPSIDVISGGFPCQDISTAGKQDGIEGARSGLWSEYLRLINELRPSYAIIENVANLLSGGFGRWFGRILLDLAEIGYDAEWHCIPAAYVGASHIRDRVWIVAYSDEKRRLSVNLPIAKSLLHVGASVFGKADVSLTDTCRGWKESARSGIYLRNDDGLSGWLDRIGMIGNSIVPQIAEAIGLAIMESWAIQPQEALV